MSVTTMLSLSVIVSVVIAVPVEDHHHLKFVAYVHRHGDRSPVGTYPTDPYGNVSLWNNGWGELTNKGKQNSFALGRWLRERYSTFLPKIYDKNDYEVQSTDISRTLMSAYLVLAGLYEPTGNDVWNPVLMWQPIPVHTTPRAMDNVLAAAKPCPRHSQLLEQLFLSTEMTNFLNAQQPVLSQIAKFSGYDTTNPVANFFLAAGVYDSLFVQSLNGYKLPNWTEPYYPLPLRDFYSMSLRLATYNRSLQRLSCGLLTKHILENLKLKSRGILKKKMWQYSAHDVTIIGLRQCLNLKETDLPSYSSSLIFELRSKNNEDFVTVLYKSDGNLKTYVVPGCTEYCPLSKFEELMQSIIPVDWEAECKPSQTD